MSMRKRESWHISLRQKFANHMLYCLTYALETAILTIHSVSVSIWRQSRWFGKSSWSLIVITNERQLGKLPLVVVIICCQVPRLNTEVYIKCCLRHVLSTPSAGLDQVLPWIKCLAAKRHNIWKQDSAQCHTKRRT